MPQANGRYGHNPEVAEGGKRPFEPNLEPTAADLRIAAVGAAPPTDRTGRELLGENHAGTAAVLRYLSLIAQRGDRPDWAPKSRPAKARLSDSKQRGPAAGYAFVSRPVSA